MVNLTRIYTRTGDAGTTRLSDLSSTRKTDPRVEAYGHVDEANSVLGIVTAMGEAPDAVLAVLRTVQNELFDVGADLSNPVVTEPAWEPLRVTRDSIERLEAWCDEFSEPLGDLVSFILPGGTVSAAHLHLARTVVRRAERAAWAAAEVHGLAPLEPDAAGAGADASAGAEPPSSPDAAPDPGSEAPDPAVPTRAEGGLNPLALTYLNRLSDLLFVLGRVANAEAGDVLWVPGKDREPVGARARRQREKIERAQASGGRGD